MHWLGRPARAAVSVLVSLALAGCGAGKVISNTVGAGDDTGPKLGTPVAIGGFIGGIAGDEPRAVRVGQQILVQNGSAADAAVAMAFALGVTLPSRAGLGGGGACLVFDPAPKSANGGAPEAIEFLPRAPATKSGARPAAIPMMARGLFALQARYGALPIEQDIVPAEQLARLGTEVSVPLADDLAVVGPALLADVQAANVFAPMGQPLGTGDLIVQRDLGSTLARLRIEGARDLYTGALATALIAGATEAGGPLTATDLANADPTLSAPLVEDANDKPKNRVAFLPPPADGGLAAAAAFQLLQIDVKALDAAQSRATGAATAWRQGGTAAEILASTQTPPAALGNLPASTSLVALDRTGTVVACALTMGNLFGTGRIAPGTGILLAASPTALPPPLLAAAIAYNPGAHAFRAAIAGSGLDYAPLGVAYGMQRALHANSAMPATVPSPGRINAIACPKLLPGDQATCTWSTDPRGGGLAVGSQ